MDEVTQGYWDGMDDEPAPGANRSDLYRFGWMNGRDDRLHKPRAPAATLRLEYERLSGLKCPV